MHVLYLNGSPKGDYSTTVQTANYIAKHNADLTFETLNVGKTIRSLETDFTPAEEAVRRADLLVFVYPVYTFLAPSQLHRFIALLKTKDINLFGKYATQITTSKHFYDTTAHAYVQENCQDLGLKFIKGLSADMDDLLEEKGQKDAIRFFDYVKWCVEKDIYEPFPKAGSQPKAVSVTIPEADTKKIPETVAVVADLAPTDAQLASMIDRFRAKCSYETKLVNIHDFPFGGGCVSCFRCAADGQCVYKDGFQELLRDEIQTSKAIVIAFRIQDHSMGPVFKTYDDRQFCNGHRTVTMGMPFGYLVEGNYSEEPNLRTVVEARAEVGGNFLCGVATDETDPDGEIDALAARLSYAVEQSYVQPANFYGVGGMKIFRDLIWQMQGFMRADHKFYKEHNQYDFPQKHRGRMLKMYLVGALFSNPNIRKKMGNKMNEGMIAPYREVVDKK